MRPVTEKKKEMLPLSRDILESLMKFQEIELDDVEISFDELELSLSPGMIPQGLPIPTLTPKSVIPEYRPTSILSAEIGIPIEEYSGEIVEVTLGATKSEGGTRSKSLTIGGEKAPAFYQF